MRPLPLKWRVSLLVGGAVLVGMGFVTLTSYVEMKESLTAGLDRTLESMANGVQGLLAGGPPGEAVSEEDVRAIVGVTTRRRGPAYRVGFDGAPGGGGSTADIAGITGWPLVMVVDARAMAASAAALPASSLRCLRTSYSARAASRRRRSSSTFLRISPAFFLSASSRSLFRRISSSEGAASGSSVAAPASNSTRITLPVAFFARARYSSACIDAMVTKSGETVSVRVLPSRRACAPRKGWPSVGRDSQRPLIFSRRASAE